jgi:hypothetical protein
MRFANIGGAMLDMAGTQAFREQRLDRLADQIGALAAKHALGLAVGEHNLTIAIDDHNRIGGGFQERLE